MTKLSFTEQIAVGLWLSAAICLGILARSIQPTMSTLIAGVFFTAPMFLLRGISSEANVTRRVSTTVFIAWAGLFVIGILSVAEQIYYDNASTYPRWLANGELMPSDSLETLREGACKGRGALTVSEKADGVFVIRCGQMWPNSKTYIAHFNPLENTK